MSPQAPQDPLNDPQYLREESRRIRRILDNIADPEAKKELAAHSLNLAQRAESIARLMEDPAVTRMNLERYREMLETEISEDERRTIDGLVAQARRALDAHRTLRELAAWYRSFAERAGHPALWEARLLMAEDLDAEADRLQRRMRDSAV